MTFSINSNHRAGSKASECVAVWKQNVQSFFAEDWSRLRTLMLELEEESWENGSTIQSNRISVQCGKIDTESTGVSDSSVIQHNGGTTDSDVGPPTRDRLTVLAEQIERRLQTANAVGK